MNPILITGAAGFLGQATGKYLTKRGHTVIGVDDYSTSSRHRPSSFPILELDITQYEKAFQEIKNLGPLGGVIHFAARAILPESLERPHEYFHINVGGTLNLAEICRRLNIRRIVYSSSCTVYGIPKEIPITEDSPLAPFSPYGESKKAAEGVLAQYASLGAFKCFSLRYFNPAGAIRELEVGECHDPETHLIPCLLEAARSGKPVLVFGQDYPTPDGSCVRDFIHLEDLCKAHAEALQFLETPESPSYLALNVGTGKGTSVLEVIQEIEKTLGLKLSVEIRPRRIGDPPHLVADTSRFKALFGWVPSKTVSQMVKDHWDYSRSVHK